MSEGILASFFGDVNKLFDARIAISSWTQVQLPRTRRGPNLDCQLTAKKRLKKSHPRKLDVCRTSIARKCEAAV